MANEAVLRARLQALLEDSRGVGFPEAIRLVRTLGSAAGPVAWELHERYRGNATRRLQSLALAALTVVDPGELLRSLQRASVEERMLACVVLAALEQDGPDDVLVQARATDRVLSLRTAVAALAVAPPTAEGERALDAHRDDPGVVAAALLSGAELGFDLRPWLADEPRRRPHADLVLRGAFLGQLRSKGEVPEHLLRAARKAFDAPATGDAVREAAALLLGAEGGIPAKPGSTPPPPGLLWHCAAAADEAHMALLQEWLGPKPSSIYEHPGRLAVCHALSHGVDQLVASTSDWANSVGADDITLAVAMRLLWRDGRVPMPFDIGAVGTRPTSSWLAWAAGATASPAAGTGDARVDAAAALAAQGRLPREAAARLLEDALWLRGSHPRLAVRQARLQLVCDLLLGGSNAGARYASAVPLHERYVVRDLPRDAPWFEVAVEVWDALSPRVLPMPARHRLH